jgi:catechol 2,3-dioxygenase-like lactoylglutathione lyase family enzyme
MSLARGVVAVLHVPDLARSRRFYAEHFGFVVLRERDDEAILDAGGGTRLLLAHHPDTTPSGHTAFSIEVDDLEAGMQALSRQGIRFEDYDLPGLRTEAGVWDQEYVRNAWFTDPDGNVVSLHEAKDAVLRIDTATAEA